MTIAISGSFYLRETGEIRNVYEIFLLAEAPIHVINIIMLLTSPILIFSNKTLIIIASYFLAGLLMSVSRVSWLICELFLLPIDTMEVFMYSRFIFQTSISAHLFVFSAERAIATCRSERYEQNTCISLILFCCFLTYPFACFLLYSKYAFPNGRQINVITFVALSLFSLLVTAIVLSSNKKKVISRRWKGAISEAYQVRENIRTSRLLLHVFSVAAFFLALSCYFLLKFSSSLSNPELLWTAITNGFLYDILVTLGQTAVMLIFFNFMIPDNVQKKWRHFLHFPCRRQIVEPISKRLKFRSIHGVDVEVGNGTAEEEAKVYFSQLSAAWK